MIVNHPKKLKKKRLFKSTLKFKRNLNFKTDLKFSLADGNFAVGLIASLARDIQIKITCHDKSAKDIFAANLLAGWHDK